MGDDSDDDNVVDDVVADEDGAYHCYESSPSSVAQGMAKMLCAPLAIFSRQRRRPNEPTEVDLVGEVQGKTCIVVDDIADTADTLCQAADKLKARGASAVLGAVVHGILSDPACESIMASQLETVFV
ncbi:prs [Symbiodinium necroappetens]|uniref:Prs protein n=1 Tax=Symbiodinium necroappetens TaxID=1628268 RepID=A0A813C8E4_9DINO|nr:prs [Symbiodinium necroappetens]